MKISLNVNKNNFKYYNSTTLYDGKKIILHSVYGKNWSLEDTQVLT